MHASRANPPAASRRPPTSPPARPPRPPHTQSAVGPQRTSLKGAPPPAPCPDSRESLSMSLRLETAHKEQLLVQVQNKDQSIVTLTAENDNLLSALNLADSRLNDLYADQARIEDEMAARIEVNEKLRAQVRELEREKRDLHKRYNEQASTFDAERQAFYDNEQHLRSRIQSLTQPRKVAAQSRSSLTTLDPDSSCPKSDRELDTDLSDPTLPANAPEQHPCTKQDLNDPECEPAEMTALKLELSTLSTSYASLQSTLILLQMQLVDLKRVNDQLQEDNESYMILLREKTLSGQFDLLKQVGGPPCTSDAGYNDDDVAVDDNADVGSLRSTGILDSVEEEITDNDHSDHSVRAHGADSPSPHRHHARHGRRNDLPSHSPSRAPRGESLAGLPITGPGLDLAAELGRAENKDILTDNSIDGDRSPLNGKGSRLKGPTDPRKVSASGIPDSNADLEALRSEVKILKDANKALSLYASKIIDRIIAEEGFEHVLAVDYEKSPNMHHSNKSLTTTPTTTVSAPVKTSQLRPQSILFSRTASDSAVTPTCAKAPLSSPPIPDIPPTNKSQRRSMSFDWKTFSMFGGGDKKSDTANLRHLTSKSNSTPLTSARKLETYEDEEDRRERERLHATMKLMGIEQPAPSPSPSPAHAVPMQKSSSNPEIDSLSTAATGRFSILRSRSTACHSDTSSANSGPSVHSNYQSTCGLGIIDSGPPGLTQEALEQAEAVNSLAVLDAHEQTLSEEIAKGRSGGFTELSQRGLGEEWRSRRSRRSGGGSSSTVWSAGMSRAGDEPDT